MVAGHMCSMCAPLVGIRSKQPKVAAPVGILMEHYLGACPRFSYLRDLRTVPKAYVVALQIQFVFTDVI